MIRNIIYNDGSLSYDEVCDGWSYIEDEYSFDSDYSNSREVSSYISQYTKEEIETILKDCISNMVKEIEDRVKERIHDVECIFNTDITSWNETLVSMKVNGNLIELKLTNDYVCDSQDDINYIYVTLYRNGKGMFTECIERIREEYEFTGSSYVPINEIELSFKALNKEQFINWVLSELA